MSTITYTGSLTTTTCWCGIQYAIPSELHAHVQSQHRDGLRQQVIYCPLGHTWTFAGKSEVEKVREALEQAQREKIWAQNRADRECRDRQSAERTASAYKGQATKARKRAAAAVCPVEGCNRSFVQIRRHLSAKHPGYVESVT